jgi:hypothetical protein
MTLFGWPKGTADSFNRLGNDFAFTYGKFLWPCNREAACKMAPVLVSLLHADPRISSYAVPIKINEVYLEHLFGVFNNREMYVTEGNCSFFSELATAFGNEDLLRCVMIIQKGYLDPEVYLGYIHDQLEKGITVSSDLQLVAKQFHKFFAHPKFQRLPSVCHQIITRSNDLPKVYRRLAQEMFEFSKNVYGKIDGYMLIFSPLSSQPRLDISYDGTNEFGGIIAYMRSLSGNKVRGGQGFTIDTIHGKFPDNYFTKDSNAERVFKNIKFNSLNGNNMLLFDFHERSIDIDGITIANGPSKTEGPKHWAVLGSEDLWNWNVIYECRGDKDLCVAHTVKYYACARIGHVRFVRFQQKSNFAGGTGNHMNLSGIEFFGECTVV